MCPLCPHTVFRQHLTFKVKSIVGVQIAFPAQITFCQFKAHALLTSNSNSSVSLYNLNIALIENNWIWLVEQMLKKNIDHWMVKPTENRIDEWAKSTCTFEVGTEFESFPDATLRVWGKSFLYILHADSSGPILALPEQAIDEHLQNTQVTLQHSQQQQLQFLRVFSKLNKPEGNLWCGY